MAKTKEPVDEKIAIAKALKTQLCSHGHAFQIRVLEEAKSVFGRGSPWKFEALEYPARAHGRSTRIDFLLRHASRPFCIAAECKRVNPKMNVWCFLRAPMVRRDRRFGERWIIERLEATRDLGVVTSALCARGMTEEAFFNFGFAIKNANIAVGDSASQGGREAIEEAAGQVMLGMAGLLDGWASRYTGGGPPFAICVIPVIFTTARLFECKTDLTTADLVTGNISVRPEDLEERPWILYQYHRSPGVTSSVQPKPFSAGGVLGESGERDPLERLDVSLARNLDATGIRTIAVVSAADVADFLKQHHLDGVSFTLFE